MPNEIQQIREHAAGIDLGSEIHFVAVPPGISPDKLDVQSFPSHTIGLKKMVEWLKACRIETIAMESTGVYWVPVYDILEQNGFEVNLVHAAYVKAVPGRKSDVMDCQWIQKLHACGLLSKCFRPSVDIVELRNLVRWRESKIEDQNRAIQHMQKAYCQMNVLLQEAVTDITGKTGIAITEAILRGEHDPEKLACLRDPRCKKSFKAMAEELSGNYRNDYIVQLKQAYAAYKFHKCQINELDIEIEEKLIELAPEEILEAPLPPKRGRKKKQGNEPSFDLRSHLYQIAGVDLTQIEGIQSLTALKILSEVGLNIQEDWSTSKKFISWLALCPGSRITGGKSKSGKTRKNANRTAATFRMAAQSLCRSKGPLGEYYRSLMKRLDRAQIVTAVAHKLARIFYAVMTTKMPYDPTMHSKRGERQIQRRLKGIVKGAKELGLVVISKEAAEEFARIQSKQGNLSTV